MQRDVHPRRYAPDRGVLNLLPSTPREGRNRRHAQRGQVVALQRAHPGGRGGRELPVHDDRAERRRRARRRRAPRAASPRPSARRRSSPTRSTSTTSPAWSPARARARASATSSSPTSARPTRSSTSSAPTATPNVVHPEGSVDPARDIETIETELIYADLEQAERRLERVVRRRAAATSTRSPRRRGCGEVVAALQAGKPGAHGAGARGRARRRATCCSR